MKTSVATTVQSSLSGDTYSMQFDAEGTAHLMGILSNMYRDAPKAVVREYAANALDSHVEAGISDPIEITLPNSWEPNLVIKDHGVGLSEKEIIEVYAQYGKSTKRDTNEQIGAFGIGAKAAFTIGSQFVVTGIKDGVKTVALFALNENNVGAVTIISSTDTDEHNGVTVSIAIENFEPVQRAARELFSTWAPGSVLIDGKAPSYSAWDTSFKVKDNLYARLDMVDHMFTVVMGGIGYPASSSMLSVALKNLPNEYHATWNRIYSRKLGLLVTVPNGSVDITPSREDLRDTAKTLKVINDAIIAYDDSIVEAIEKEVDAVESGMHASVLLKSKSAFLNGLAGKNIKWRKNTLNYKVTLPYPVVYRSRGRNRGYVSSVYDTTEVYLGYDFSKVLVITGCNDKSLGSVRRSATKYLAEHSSYEQLLLVPSSHGNVDWFQWGKNAPIDTVTFAEFKEACKKIASYSDRFVNPITYSVFVDGQYTSMSPKELKASDKRIVYTDGRHTVNSVFFKHVFKDDAVIVLSNRQTTDALLTRVPGVASAYQILKDEAIKFVENVTDEEKAVINFTADSGMDRLQLLVEDYGDTSILGPELEQYIAAKKASQSVHSATSNYDLIRAAYYAAGKSTGSVHDYYNVVRKIYKQFPYIEWFTNNIRYSRVDEKKFRKHTVSYLKSVIDYENLTSGEGDTYYGF